MAHRVRAHVGPMSKNNQDPIEVRRSSTTRVTRMRTAIIGGAVVTSLAATGTLVALQGAGAATATSGTTSSSGSSSQNSSQGSSQAGSQGSDDQGRSSSPRSALVTQGNGNSSSHATSKGS